MPFLAAIPLIAAGAGGIFGAKKLLSGKKQDPYADLLGSLNPLIESQRNIATKESDAGLALTGKAAGDLDYVTKFFKDILEGSPDDILKMFDSSELTRNDDENEAQLSELGVRGGRRAATLGGSAFDRNSSINRMLQQIKFGAPDKIANVAQVLGNLGLGELSASTGSAANASNILFGVEGIKQADKDRKAALIGSIFEAIGGVAGAVACWAIHGSHIIVPGGRITSNLVKIGDQVLSFDKETGEKVVRKIIRIEKTPRQITRIITNGNTIIRVTPTHEFYNDEFEEILTANLDTDDLLTIAKLNGEISLIDRPITIMGEEVNDVMIVKLDDEDNNYPIIVNGYLCADADSLVKGDNQ